MRNLLGRIETRLGHLPNFFLHADGSHLYELWDRALDHYLNSPLPSIFKEKMFARLSRHGKSPYCYQRHVGNLAGYGYISGNANIAPLHVATVLMFTSRPDPSADRVINQIGSLPAVGDWPSDKEALLIDIAELMYNGFDVPNPAIMRLRDCLGSRYYLALINLIDYIRTAHLWTASNPDIQAEIDIKALFLANPELMTPYSHGGARCSSNSAFHSMAIAG